MTACIRSDALSGTHNFHGFDPEQVDDLRTGKQRIDDMGPELDVLYASNDPLTWRLAGTESAFGN
jgi:hypothetical protein